MKRHARIALRRTTATRVPTAEKPWDLQERLIEEKSDRHAFVFIFAQPATEVDAVNKDQTFLTLIRVYGKGRNLQSSSAGGIRGLYTHYCSVFSPAWHWLVS